MPAGASSVYHTVRDARDILAILREDTLPNVVNSPETANLLVLQGCADLKVRKIDILATLCDTEDGQ